MLYVSAVVFAKLNDESDGAILVFVDLKFRFSFLLSVLILVFLFLHD